MQVAKDETMNKEYSISSNLVIAGVDEAGRGPLAGPVTAACVILPDGFQHELIRDSKKLSPTQREVAYEVVTEQACVWSVVAVGNHRIDRMNIREATRLAMKLAAERAEQQMRGLGFCGIIHFIIDGNMKFSDGDNEEPVVKGDSKFAQVSAASIIAKVTRDRMMEKLHHKYPGYGFDVHKGYPTAQHRRAVADNGPSRIHRVTFRGVMEYVGPRTQDLFQWNSTVEQ